MKKASLLKKVNYLLNQDYDCEIPFEKASKSVGRLLRSEIKKICKENNYNLLKDSINYGFYSCFISNGDKIIYINIGDYRFYSNFGLNDILYREAEHIKDFRGKSNNSSDWDNLSKNLKKIFD